ncbi:MAG: TerC family protein [Actinomycetota bacterium]|nr:TerC family protein [Actinomycetota bacterium]
MPEFLSGELFARFLGILAIDLILSGDNAVVIALAVRQLKGDARRKAIILGATGAVLLRLFFAAIITFLLQIPLLQAVGGLLLLWVAWKLIHDSPGGEEENVQAGGNLWEAIRIIIIADVVMSLDNVVALVGVSGGNLALLVFGLALTIPLIIWGSTLLSALLDRWRWLVYVGAGILVYVAVEMLFEDRVVHGFIGDSLQSLETVIALAVTAVFVALAWLWARRESRSAAS